MIGHTHLWTPETTAAPPVAVSASAACAVGLANRGRCTDWRVGTQTAEPKTILKRRKLIELIHARGKNRVPERLRVRGSIKIQTIALWQAVTNNIMAAHRLRSAAAREQTPGPRVSSRPKCPAVALTQTKRRPNSA